jgi:hypothetical protein
MNAIAIFMGGHVRTGLEDRPYPDYHSRLCHDRTSSLYDERQSWRLSLDGAWLRRTKPG